MKKITVLIIILSLLVTGCTNNSSQMQATETLAPTQVPTLVPTEQPTPEPTLEPTPEPTAAPSKPKYIFIVIGDGFGKGAMMMGEIYSRLENEDMTKGAVWEGYSQQKMVDGRGESASGGTAISTGYVVPSSVISQTDDYKDLRTIMDRAKQNGMSTGVITNSFILDATPATFLTHDDWRLNFKKLAQRVVNCNVDYIAGGGLMRFVPQYYYYMFNSSDARNRYIKSRAHDSSSFKDLLDLGYEPYLGLEGAQSFSSQVDAGTFSEDKALCLFTESTMPYEITKMSPDNIEYAQHVPTLVDMTNGGIQMLSQNPNGFVMMIEEASIDKISQDKNQTGNVAQVRLLNDTLKAIEDFYNKHPYETLVILTADHETGDYQFDLDKFEQFKTWPNFVWSDDPQQTINFLNNSWGLEVNESKVNKYIQYSNDKIWETEWENKANLLNYITNTTSLEIGIKANQGLHSWQQVPCYVNGTGSHRFAEAEGIEDIPIIICDIMGWEALPEVIQD